MLSPVPKDWQDGVIAVLKTKDSKKIRITADCLEKFGTSFPSAHPASEIIRKQFLVFLQKKGHDLKGCLMIDPQPDGEGWHFFFKCLGKTTYGKIILVKDKKSIKVLSAHLPNKGDKLPCEPGYKK